MKPDDDSDSDKLSHETVADIDKMLAQCEYCFSVTRQAEWGQLLIDFRAVRTAITTSGWERNFNLAEFEKLLKRFQDLGGRV